VTGNAELAEQLRRQADDAIKRRRILLVAAVALAESNTIAGARKILDDWDGPTAIRDAALELLSQLTRGLQLILKLKAPRALARALPWGSLSSNLEPRPCPSWNTSCSPSTSGRTVG
jgi:hypothetical protein